jgi:hypothetical protein
MQFPHVPLESVHPLVLACSGSGFGKYQQYGLEIQKFYKYRRIEILLEILNFKLILWEILKY